MRQVAPAQLLPSRAATSVVRLAAVDQASSPRLRAKPTSAGGVHGDITRKYCQTGDVYVGVWIPRHVGVSILPAPSRLATSGQRVKRTTLGSTTNDATP